VSERLYRVARRAAKEVDKRVNLDIRGGTVEIDRSVLERMAGSFEHLLRNHIVHGIESRAMRREAGKNETGELLVEVRQEGNEIVLTFSDDGTGIDHDRIRAKARALGLIGPDDTVSDAAAAEFIFHPGFSTATEITELAGRGIGMDVVRSEAATLGGRVTIDSERRRGTRFTITLPLTLAVTQVVLVSVSGRTFALPAVLVEQVRQLRPQPLADAYRAGRIDRAGEGVSLVFLGALLDIDQSVPVAQRSSPVLMLRSAGESLAIHVDEVVGNQEVVVKTLGPQLARMSGIAGATVLGSGEIVLILNPVQLAQAFAVQKSAAATAPVMPTLEVPSEGLQTLPTVMVVDDSLTVRRVTQRLLSREGYQVVLAKDGVDALEQLQDYAPDVMLVDIEMPRMDGFDLTRHVRGDERLKHIPIVMITSRTANKHRDHALALGVDEYLGKPYQEDELLELLATHIKARKAQPA
jgi:chemosensory pili system protein ChpA (sensor histidine kinase/response regulator)